MKTQDDVYEIARHFVEDYRPELGDEIADRVLGWIRQRNLAKLAECSLLVFDPEYRGVVRFRLLRQVGALFKKNSAFIDGQGVRAVAYSSFLEHEIRCAYTNLRLDEYYMATANLLPGDETPEEYAEIHKHVLRAQAYISRVLGSFSGFLASIPENIRVTSGATSTRSRRESVPFLKISRGHVPCTAAAKPYLAALGRFFGFGLCLEEQPWCRVEFVRKNWKTDRLITCDSTGNVPLQLAFDSYAKRRLRNVGIDLGDQTRNQTMAFYGSVDGSAATIDLKAASDTVAFNTVALLFPEEWFNYLDSVRTPMYKIEDQEPDRFFKFSSMGNGSTFCIETLIFAACCHAVGSQNFSVYGDDIIVETGKYESLVWLLDFFGFTVNTDKSYASGPFRESCGKDWYRGIDVTPFYLREMDGRKAMTCHNVNGLARISLPGGRLWNYLRDLTRRLGLLLVPVNEVSTSGVFVDPSTANRLKLIRKSHRYLTVPIRDLTPIAAGKYCPVEKWTTSEWMPSFKAYVAKSGVESVEDSRTWFLWWLGAQGRRPLRGYSKGVFPSEPGAIPYEPRMCSSVPILSHRYEKQWVRWWGNPSPVASADSMLLSMWSDFLSENLPSDKGGPG